MTVHKNWRKWTPEDEARLREMWPTHSLDEMEMIFGRPKNHISRKAHYMSLGARPMTPERKQQIVEQMRAISDKAREGFARKFARKPLTDGEMNTIRAMRAAGGFIHDIAKAIRRDERMVGAVIRAMPDDPMRQRKQRNPRDDAGEAPLAPGHPIALAELERARSIDL